MKMTTEIFYTLNVLRGTMIEYSATKYPSVADARVAAKRLGEYVEIRRIRIVRKSELVTRIEA